MRTEAVKRVLAGRWEKAALAASAAGMLSYLLCGVLMARPDPLVAEAEELIRNVALAHQGVSPESFAPATRLRRVEEAFSRPVDAAAGGAWTYYRPARVSVTLRAAIEETPAEPVTFRGPVVTSIGAEAGRVTLAWQEDPANNVKAVGYWVYRRKRGGEFERITRNPVREARGVDAAVEAKADYEYAVSAVTDDARVSVGDAGTGVREGPRGDAKAVRTAGVIRLEWQGAGEGGEPLANVVVHKFVAGRWWRKTYTVREGERIGGPETFWREGRQVAVDLSTGCEVLGIAQVRVQRSRGGTAYETDAWKVTVRDDEGTTREVMIE